MLACAEMSACAMSVTTLSALGGIGKAVSTQLTVMYPRPALWRRQVHAAEGYAGNVSDPEDRQGPTCAFSQDDRKQMDEERGA